MIAVCRKELRSYRISMIGYVFVAFMLAVVSLYFAYQNLNLASPRFELVLQIVQFIFLVFVPILTMRVLAEEKKQKTDQLLLTLPMTVKDIVIGKYLAVVVLFTIPMLIICIYPLILTMFGTVNLPAAYFSILGFYLLGCANIAIGVFFSSVTENPVISAVMTFGTLLVCYLMNYWLQQFAYHVHIGILHILLPLFFTVCITLLTVCLNSYRTARNNPVDSIKYE